MLGVDVGFWEATMKPAEDHFAPSTPDTPDLTVRLGNRLGTLTTPEGDPGMFLSDEREHGLPFEPFELN